MNENFILVLSNGVELHFAAGSYIEDLRGIYESFEQIDNVRALLTEENLKGATFNGETIANYIPLDVTVSSTKPGELIEAHFRTYEKSQLEILQEQITELQEALAEIAG